jgi:hypothetical protein
MLQHARVVSFPNKLRVIRAAALVAQVGGNRCSQAHDQFPFPMFRLSTFSNVMRITDPILGRSVSKVCAFRTRLRIAGQPREISRSELCLRADPFDTAVPAYEQSSLVSCPLTELGS